MTEPAEVELVVKEVRAVLAGPAATRAFAAVDAARGRGAEPDPRPLYRLLGQRRLLAVSWPRAYGGRDLPGRCAAAVVGELIAGGVPEVLHTLSVQICGNFLLTAGTDEQRAAVLPGLASGALTATVLYSEPDVGSDLSTVQTRAERTGAGGWRITGRKVYSVKTPLADIGLVAARTSDETSQYQGITLFLVPLDAPGVTVDALDSFADENFADVRLADVRVPAGAVVGPVGGAWPLITDALALERTGVDYVAKADLWLRTWPGGEPAERGRLRTRTAAARALAMRCVDQQDTGRVDPVAAAATKLWCSETARSVAWWVTDTAGPAALWQSGDDEALGDGRLEAAYREAPGLTLSAGTSEMMLELVAGSGLPTPESFPAGDEPLAAELRKAVRAIATAYDERDPARACWPDLARIDLFGLALPTGHGGLDLGPGASVVCCAELGRELHDDGLLDTLTAIDALAAAGRPVTIDGSWRASLVDTRRPGRPVVDPGGADTLIAIGAGKDGPVLTMLDHDSVTTRARRTAAGPVTTVHCGSIGDDVLCRGEPAVEVLAADRIRRAAWLCGLAAGALAHTVQRARTRRQFGRLLGENQAVAFRLARLAVRHDAVSALITDLAGELADGVVDPALTAGALAEAATLAMAAGREGVQLHGAFGMTAGSPVRRYYLAAPAAVAADAGAGALYAAAGAS